uniref:Uncharacterized protein n=1 Tax=Yersinia enterocolitica W22703 TaxID=913028 RepID=F4N5X4_YEREN|nr:unknown protein [Yersinia enterocolitica W22703]
MIYLFSTAAGTLSITSIARFCCSCGQRHHGAGHCNKMAIPIHCV